MNADKHITVSGDLGSGKTTVASILADQLETDLVATGVLQRQIAAELNLSTLEANLRAERDTAIDKRIDALTQEMSASASKPLVFDSRMAWYFVKSALRVRLVVDPEVAVKRISNRTADTVEVYLESDDIRQMIRARYESERRRFLTTYGVDLTELHHYNLVLDTSDLTASTVANSILEQYLSLEARISEVLVSARRVVPAFSASSTEDAKGKILAVYKRPFFLALSGQDMLSAALHDQKDLVSLTIDFTGISPGVDEATLKRWEAEHDLDFTSFRLWRAFTD